MERILTLLHSDLAISPMLVQFGLTGVLAAAAGLLWREIVQSTRASELRPAPIRRG